MPEVSFVVPAHNEEGSLPILVEEIRAAAKEIGRPYEILIVEDGSTDGTRAWLEAEAARADDLAIFQFPENRGQSAAMAAGLLAARGDLIVTMDADLQNDPGDAPKLVAALDKADLACGVRQKRKDTAAKRVASRMANWIRRRWLPLDVYKDVGCSRKAWRRPVALAVPKFNGFHRYIPIFATQEGFRVVEVPVSHRPREHGETHYTNWGRALRGIYDLIGVRWMLKRHVRTDGELTLPDRDPA